MTVKLYGISGSRALRSIWAIEEVGIDYEHVPTHFIGDSKTPEFMAVNPNGRIPALQDGDLTLFESMAINLYLAKKYGGVLYPSGPGAEAMCWQWSVWGISEIEPLQMEIVGQKFFTPKEKRNPKAIARAEKGLVRPLDVLNTTLADREWLVGDAFGVADLNVAGVMLLFELIEFDTTPWQYVSRWITQCYERPALASARAKD